MAVRNLRWGRAAASAGALDKLQGGRVLTASRAGALSRLCEREGCS